MSDIQRRPFSKDYSGLINQSVLAIGITALCVAAHEFLKRKRRRKAIYDSPPSLGSRDSWSFGYLYNARSWARFPSPPSPPGLPLSWVKPILNFPESKLLELRGIDATIYVRFLRGCFWYSLLHCLTTFPILFPIHIDFSEASVSSKSMTRASISSLVRTAKGRSLLGIHICLLVWLALTWFAVLIWICDGAFKMRAMNIEAASRNTEARDSRLEDGQTYHRHPHTQYGFMDIPSREGDRPVRGLRFRTIMVTNIPYALRSEMELRSYFEYYMSRKVEKPAVGMTSSTQPGFIINSLAFLLNRAKWIETPTSRPLMHFRDGSEDKQQTVGVSATSGSQDTPNLPIIERVVIACKMTELASLLERREEVLVLLETAHIKLAHKVLSAVRAAVGGGAPTVSSKVANKRTSDVEQVDPQRSLDQQNRMELLVRVLGPFINDQQRKATANMHRGKFRSYHLQTSQYDHALEEKQVSTVWGALLSLPRNTLDAYQPLIHLSHLYTGKVVPSIDYYTTKLNFLSSLITENRAKSVADFDPTSTAFVTFADPEDARRACKFLAVHPNNPLACMVKMAPMYSDVDWMRVMKSSLKVEVVKDWVVSLSVWAFTLFWLFPVSFLVGLVSIQNISIFWPALKAYLERNPDKSEVLQSLLPTLLVSLVSLLIPPILLLIAKKMHLITTISARDDMVTTRYYKFLVVNVLIFFCVGTAAMQSLLQSIGSSSNHQDILQIVGDSFPTAGPFYVGWLIFSTALHGGIELCLLGLPLFKHLFRIRQIAPRKRSVYLRPLVPNFFYWFPNHCLVLHIILVFSVLNPLVIPFGLLYFFIQTGVIKNQFIHVYSKHYEGDGKVLLIRFVRYSLDGLLLSQAVFLAYMVVLRKSVNAGLAAVLIFATALVKLILTRMCRTQFELDDAAEADTTCKGLYRQNVEGQESDNVGLVDEAYSQTQDLVASPQSFLTIRLPRWINFSYATFDRHHGIRGHRPQHRRPNPFGPHGNSDLTDAMPAQPTNPPIDGLPDYLADGPSRSNNFVAVVPRKGVQENLARSNALESHSPVKAPVTPHPPPQPWDDQNLLDLPYDNPFYSRAIDSALWLPRDPTAQLDLDDTIDLKLSITVDEAAGRLGSWILVDGVSSTPEEISIASNRFGSVVPRFPVELQEVDGTEEIDLPPVIAQRVQANEKHIERVSQHRRPLTPRRVSSQKSFVGSEAHVQRQRSSILVPPPLNPLTSTSIISSRRPRSGSLISTWQLSPPVLIDRSYSADHRSGEVSQIRPEFIGGSANVSSPLSLVAPPLISSKSHRSQTIPAARAIFHEVLEEEREAQQELVAQETAEGDTQVKKGWKSSLTSWLYWRSE